MRRDDSAAEAFLQRYRDATGDATPLAGAFSFGDSPAMADELGALVRDGPKRATAAALAQFDHDGEAPPRPGQLWTVLDGRGQPMVMIRTVEVRTGPLDQLVDPAFAWDEGEGDRTLEWWLDAHRRFWSRTLPPIGARYADDLPVALERFTVVWPDPDAPTILAERDGVHVRELRWDERGWATDVLQQRWGGVVVGHGEAMVPAGMPALVAVEDDHPVGLLTFRPRPGVATEVVTLDALSPGRGVGRLLLTAVERVARRHGWRRLWLLTTNDNLQALRTYQRAGWRLTAVHPGAVDRSRELKPSIPAVGLDGIPIRDELELELPLE